jgi:hypothetical protein
MLQMTKFLNKWTHVFHRWIALPTIIIIPLAVIAKFTSSSGATPSLAPGTAAGEFDATAGYWRHIPVSHSIYCQMAAQSS